MIHFRFTLIIFFLFINHLGFSQFIKNNDQLKKDLKSHILFLANDSLHGRATGSNDEKIAREYILKKFKSIGLTQYPVLNDDYQTFNFTSSVYLGKNNTLKIIDGGTNINLPIYQSFYPINESGNGTAFSRPVYVGFGIIAPQLSHNDYSDSDSSKLKNKIFVMKTGFPDANPHSKFSEYNLEKRIELAISKGASGIILINDQDEGFNPDSSIKIKGIRKNIPIIFLSDKKFNLPNRWGKDPVFFMETNIIKVENTGYNVLGYIDNKKQNTIVIGAHYDHLGLGEHGGSLHTSKNEIHNGADDNASGVAGLLELAFELKKSNLYKNNNYLFIAFSGEELGLYGSANFIKKIGFASKNINYMLNMDMIGRLDTNKNIIAISGTGTSPSWTYLDSIKNTPFQIKKSESGIGPSDHASFYKENIPVLHFFSGNHADYHKPSDDEMYINYDGEVNILYYMMNLISKLDHMGKLKFTQTKDDNNENKPRYKITMGIMPDYLFEGKGIKVDGVTEGKPAFGAGILKGDIILELNNISTNDMQSYMKALGSCEKGKQSQIIVLRDNKEVKLTVQF